MNETRSHNEGEPKGHRTCGGPEHESLVGYDASRKAGQFHDNTPVFSDPQINQGTQDFPFIFRV